MLRINADVESPRTTRRSPVRTVSVLSQIRSSRGSVPYRQAGRLSLTVQPAVVAGTGAGSLGFYGRVFCQCSLP